MEGATLGALIMLGALFGLIALVFALVLRFDPEARAQETAMGRLSAPRTGPEQVRSTCDCVIR